MNDSENIQESFEKTEEHGFVVRLLSTVPAELEAVLNEIESQQ